MNIVQQLARSTVLSLALTLLGHPTEAAEGAAPVEADWNSITFTGTVPVDGSALVKMWPDGRYQFTGTMHASADPDYDPTLMFAVKSSQGRVFTFVHSGRLASTPETGSRDDTWNDTGVNPQIKTYWAELRDGYSWEAHASTSRDVGAIWEEIRKNLGPIGEVVHVVGKP